MAKVWLQPLAFAYSEGLNPAELRRLREIVFENRAMFVTRWNEHFSR